MDAVSNVYNAFSGTFAIIGVAYCSFTLAKLVYTVLKAIRSFFLAPLLNLGAHPSKFGSWAVVTGSTDGIGKAYAIALAKKGVNIVLISRTTSKLEAVANEIASVSKVKTKCITADFSGGVEIYDAIQQELEGLEIGVLVNNVGMAYEYPEYVHEVPDRDQTFNRLLHINIFPVTFMTTMVLSGMVAKRKGAIINIGSASCFGFPLLTVYAASKAYVDSFSKNLQSEYEHKGIIIQSVYPHIVSTKMSRTRSTFMTPSAEKYANSALSTLGLESETAGCFAHWLVNSLLQESMPSWVVMRVCRSLAMSTRARALKKKAAKAE